jgi:putative phosphonate catabolism associated alcohol dehydrogenase
MESHINESAALALFHGSGIPFEIREYSISPPDADHVLVQVSLATICGSDLHTFTGRRSAPTPCILGHEAVGRVAAPTNARDADGNPLREGDRVTWSIMAACGRCKPCTAWDLPQKCDRLFKYGHARSEAPHFLNGGFAEYIRLRPGTAIYRIPDAVTDAEAAPLNCALATVVDGLNLLEIKPGASAVVLGAGLLGVYAVCCLRERGCEVTAIVDSVPERLRIAKTFGATHAFNLSERSPSQIGEALHDLTDGYGVDLAVEVSGATPALVNAVEWLRVGGQCLTLGYVFPHAEASLDAHKIVTKCLTLRGNHNYHFRALGAALRFVEAARNRRPFEHLIGARYPLRDIDAAFHRAMQRDVIRVAIEF